MATVSPADSSREDLTNYSNSTPQNAQPSSLNLSSNGLDQDSRFFNKSSCSNSESTETAPNPLADLSHMGVAMYEKASHTLGEAVSNSPIATSVVDRSAELLEDMSSSVLKTVDRTANLTDEVRLRAIEAASEQVGTLGGKLGEATSKVIEAGSQAVQDFAQDHPELVDRVTDIGAQVKDGLISSAKNAIKTVYRAGEQFANAGSEAILSLPKQVDRLSNVGAEMVAQAKDKVSELFGDTHQPQQGSSSFSGEIIASDGANIRSTPGTNIKPIGFIKYGEQIKFDAVVKGEFIDYGAEPTIKKSSDLWYRIQGTSSYVSAAIVEAKPLEQGTSPKVEPPTQEEQHSEVGSPKFTSTPKNISPSSELETNSVALSIKSGDTLWDIAAKELGDPNDWIAIRESDRTNFTEEEAKHLQIGSKVYLPKNLVISFQDDQPDKVLVTATPEAQKHLETIPRNRTETKSGLNPEISQTPSLPAVSNAESGTVEPKNELNLPSNPRRPFLQPNIGYKVSSEVFKGGNFDAGLFRAVVVDDSLEGKISFEPNWKPGQEESGDEPQVAFFSPDYAATLNVEVSDGISKIESYWETEIIKGLLKWDQSKGPSVQIGGLGALEVWVSEVGGSLFNPKTGSPTTNLTVAIEGKLSELVPEEWKSQEWFKLLDLATGKVEGEYKAEIAWEPKPIPGLLTPQPVPVYVNDPLPTYSPAREPVGINPYPIDEPRKQPEIPPQPDKAPESIPVINPYPREEPSKQPVTQPQQSQPDSSANKPDYAQIAGNAGLVLAGTALVVGTIVEDVGTGGVGIADDPATLTGGGALVLKGAEALSKMLPLLRFSS